MPELSLFRHRPPVPDGVILLMRTTLATETTTQPGAGSIGIDLVSVRCIPCAEDEP
jgi:hypothetical protein